MCESTGNKAELIKQIDEIMDNFEWDKALDIMQYLDWTYFDDEPVTIDALKDTAWVLLHEVSKHSGLTTARTGGMLATNVNGKLSLYLTPVTSF